MSVAQFCTCLSFLARLKADCWTQDLTIKPKLTSHSACHYGGLLYVWVMKHQHHWQAWLQFPRKISTVKLIWSSRRTAFTVCFPLCVSVFPHVHFPSQYRTALTQWMLQWKVQDGTSVFENGWSGTNWSVCVCLSLFLLFLSYFFLSSFRRTLTFTLFVLPCCDSLGENVMIVLVKIEKGGARSAETLLFLCV